MQEADEQTEGKEEEEEKRCVSGALMESWSGRESARLVYSLNVLFNLSDYSLSQNHVLYLLLLLKRAEEKVILFPA